MTGTYILTLGLVVTAIGKKVQVTDALFDAEAAFDKHRRVGVNDVDIFGI
jgi:hypothetical protein